MRVLLDECVDQRLAREIVGHDVRTVGDLGWSGAKNGDLLARAETAFDAFVTVDRNLAFQQYLPRFSVAVIVLRAPSNRVSELQRLVPKQLEALAVAKGGEVTWVA